MRKLILLIVPLVLATVVFGVFLFLVSRENGKGALQVTSLPKSTVYLNDKKIGQTPLCIGIDPACKVPTMLDTGDYSIRLTPEDKSFSAFEERIKIKAGVLTVVDRTFAQAAGSEGSIISLTKLPNTQDREVLVLSSPDRAKVLLDNNATGTTPLLLKEVTESDHEITVKKEGYKEKTIRVRAISGYKLEASVFLGISETVASPSAAATSSATPKTIPGATSAAVVAKVLILQTPTGFLRVRQEPTLAGVEIGRVIPGEQYDFVEEKPGWFSIKLSDGKVGWVSASYSQKE